MADNRRGAGKRVRVTATADLSSGEVALQSDFHGVVVNDALTGEVAILAIEQVEYEVSAAAMGGTPAVGADVWLDVSNPPDLIAADGGGDRLVGKVTANDTDPGVPAGSMRMILRPQD